MTTISRCGLPTVAALAGLLGLFVVESAEGARRRPPPREPEPQTLRHSFGGPATEPDVVLALRPIRGDLLARPGGGTPVDRADYAAAGTLEIRRELLLGPLPSGHVVVPPGRYRVGIQPHGAGGLPLVLLRGDGGLRLNVPMALASRPAGRVAALHAEELGAGESGEPWPLALHLPTTSGLLVLGPPTEVAPPAGQRAGRSLRPGQQRRRSRAEILEERRPDRPRRRRSRRPAEP